MASNKKTARLAGFLYLIVVLTGIFSLAYVPANLFEWKDAAKTFQNITASQTLFRLSLLMSAVCYVAFLFLPLVLYRLLSFVNETAARLMVVLAVVSVPISFLNLQSKYAVLDFINGAKFLGDLSEKELHSQVMMLLGSYNDGILIVQVFWGLWLLPFGYLVYKSGILPKVLGIFLMLGCFGYLINFAGHTMLPDYGQTIFNRFDTLPATIGEIGSCLWLLIFGAKETTEK
jgi:hypothetical protein